MNYTSKRKYAGCYAINAEGIQLDLEESSQSCCGKGVPPLWMLYYDGCIDVGEFESKRNALHFLSVIDKAELLRRIDGRRV